MARMGARGLRGSSRGPSMLQIAPSPLATHVRFLEGLESGVVRQAALSKATIRSVDTPKPGDNLQ